LTPEQRAQNIRLLLLDVDGVLTDGRIYYTENGDEIKAFHIQDGLGIKLLQHSGIEVGIITGRSSTLLQRRTSELGIELLIQGREDKTRALEEVLQNRPYPLDAVAFMGDDLPDLGPMRRVGLALTVANCASTVAQHIHWRATRRGGEGAVREAAEFILAAQDKLDSATAAYL